MDPVQRLTCAELLEHPYMDYSRDIFERGADAEQKRKEIGEKRLQKNGPRNKLAPFPFGNLPSILTIQPTSPGPTKSTYQIKAKSKFDHLPNI